MLDKNTLSTHNPIPVRLTDLRDLLSTITLLPALFLSPCSPSSARSIIPQSISSISNIFIFLSSPSNKQGRVRTKTVKRASKVLIEKYYPRLTLDFQTNKKIASEVAIIPSKRLRNKIAGFTTHLMKRIQRGPVRGISFKLQEEERERKDNYIPEFSALDTSAIEIDTDTQALLKSLNFEDLAGVTAVEVKQAPVDTFRKPRGDRKERA
ncbi:40S ribosomal protein S17 [Mortierella sp. GBA39]|nr:40S ribosomal protein S17 [Mortierella sp. GBA39]